MAQVGIVMGSDSDMPVMAKAADILEGLGFPYRCGLSRHTGSRMCFLNMPGQRRRKVLK